jgi:hypothetical protein
MRKREKDLKSVIASTGVVLVSQTINGSGNFKFEVAMGDQRKIFTAPTHSASWNSIENFRKDIERWKRSLSVKRASQ